MLSKLLLMTLPVAQIIIGKYDFMLMKNSWHFLRESAVKSLFTLSLLYFQIQVLDKKTEQMGTN